MKIDRGHASTRGVSSACSHRRRGSHGAAIVASVALLLAVASLMLASGLAQAAVIHQLLPEPSKAISEGVPVSSGAAVPGPLGEVNSATVAAGQLLVAEKAGEFTRVDKFDASTGVFLPPQLTETPLVTGFDRGIAAEPAGEKLTYVGAFKEGAPVVAVFAPSGALLGTWNGAATASHALTGEIPEDGVAIDSSSNPLTDWSAGDVYVAAGRSVEPVVDVFKPGSSEQLAGELKGTCKLPEEECSAAEAVPFTGRPSAVAVSALNSEVFVIDENQVVDVFKPGAVPGRFVYVGQLAGPPPAGAFGRPTRIAVDNGNGDIYVAEGEGSGGRPPVVDEFNAEHKYVGQITGTPTESVVKSLAVDPETHHVLVGSFNQTSHSGQFGVFGEDLIVPDVETTGATSAPESVNLRGNVNPLNQGPASCGFAWGTTSALGNLVSCTTANLEGGAPLGVQASLTGLAPDTTYFYRLQASNPNGTNPGEEWQTRTVTTTGPGLHGESALNVSSSSATLEASIDPHNAPTSFIFQYGTTTSYGLSTPSASVGGGEGDVQVSQHIRAGLVPNTLYHYRVVAVTQIEGRTESFPGPDHTFTTQAGGSALILPDGRQWEMVSPPEKRGAELLGIGNSNVTQASPGGEALTFNAFAPTEGNPEGFASSVGVLARRGPGGWSSHDLSPAIEVATGVTDGSGYRLFNEALSEGVVQPFGAFVPSLSREASEQTAYLHTNFLAGSSAAFCTESCYRPLVSGCPATGTGCAPSVREDTNVPDGTVFGCPHEVLKSVQCGPHAIGATPDLKHIILESKRPLTPGANTGNSLYEWSGGHLALVNVLPCSPAPCQGAPATQNPVLGYEGSIVRNVVSNDGSRVVWSENGSHLYLRDTAKRETVRLDVAQPNASGTGLSGPVYQAASTDGTRIFFTDEQQLTERSGPGLVNDADLYECEIVEEAGRLHCNLSDLTPVTAAGEPAEVLDILPGASEDGSWLYFVANGKLAPSAVHGTCPRESLSAPPGQLCNLYVRHGGETRLVAVLAAKDYPDWNGSNSKFRVAKLASRVSPDGRWATFTSQRSLTGYDSRDAATGQPDEEVYVYDAVTGHMSCASCNPTGARPKGTEYAAMTNPTLLGREVWEPGARLAGALPAWTTFDEASSVYQSRYLSDNGRVFFDSPDALVPLDGNGTTDVYEFEPLGVGGCTTSTATGSDVFSATAGGCVALISSGTAKQESGFLDASANGGRDSEGHEGGGDVFFLTSARLARQDFDSSLDVYTAHECSSASPCPPQSAELPPPCATGDACKPAPSPQPTIFGAPASATFSGPGNSGPPPQSVKRKAKTAAQIRAEKLAKALKACRAKHDKHRRHLCEVRARKSYGPRTRGHKATRRGKR